MSTRTTIDASSSRRRTTIPMLLSAAVFLSTVFAGSSFSPAPPAAASRSTRTSSSRSADRSERPSELGVSGGGGGGVENGRPRASSPTTVAPEERRRRRYPFGVFDRLDELYTESSVRIKCPFFRRRAADLIDGIAMVARFLVVRHKSLLGDAAVMLTTTGDDETDEESIMLPPGCRSAGRPRARKRRGLSTEDLAAVLRRDWTASSASSSSSRDKGYYVTGRLSTAVYRDDCLFTGPDPDMPVRGLRKYLAAASKLFDHRRSFADLLDLTVVENDDDDDDDGGRRTIEARWRIGGVLMLPWHPVVEPYTGRTTYHVDEEGLIFHHEEHWDISVWQAFTKIILQ